MSKLPLTEKQISVLRFIGGFIETNSYSPVEREIMEMMQFKTLSTAKYFLIELEKKGYLRRKPHRKYRNIMLTPKAQNELSTRHLTGV